ncbi:hypothetical protein [Paenibacillus kobensis]|uniref:hypothetical protein n=1 Tax=Paenibacillus kobensis TaxID=59841 RepID=UPI000FD79993|nr:hypothetical protein [Paenibacillus kobensis]
MLGLASWKGQTLHAVFADGTWRRWDGTDWITMKSGLNTSADWSFVNFKGGFGETNLIGTNGVDPVQRFDGSIVQLLANAPAGANYINEHDNRLYCAVGNRIHYTGINLAEEWTLTGRPNDSSPGTIGKETYRGEDIIGLRAGTGHLSVFFPSSSYELYGTDRNSFDLSNAIAEDFGALNNKAMTNLESVLYFVDETGIYEYSGGVRPRKKFSQPVQWYIDNMNKALKQQCCAGSDGRYLYVALPMGSTVDTVLVWDSQIDQWDVWNDLQPTHIVKMGETLYMADAQGRVLQMGGTTDNGVAISCEVISKTFTVESMSQRIRWPRLWVTVEKPVGSTLQVYLSKEPSGESWTLVSDLSASQAINNRICVNPFQVAQSNTLRFKLTWTGQVTVREISMDERNFPVV